VVADPGVNAWAREKPHLVHTPTRPSPARFLDNLAWRPLLFFIRMKHILVTMGVHS
jgi:hypothetical protein